MKKYLFLNDERMPGDVTWVYIGKIGASTTNWNIVRSYQEAIEWVLANGFPNVISFDHDLGLEHYGGDYSGNNTGYDFAKWLVEYDIDTNTMPDDFAFTVHSKNPIGSTNIEKMMNNYIKFKRNKTSTI